MDAIEIRMRCIEAAKATAAQVAHVVENAKLYEAYVIGSTLSLKKAPEPAKVAGK
jgi:hypothetical protein